MTSDADNVFDQILNKLRKKKGLCPPTPEEAAEAFKKAKPIPLTDDEHESIVNAMLSETRPVRDVEPSEHWLGAPLDLEIDAECEAICRNPGEGDEETDDLEAQLEHQLLDEDDDEA